MGRESVLKSLPQFLFLVLISLLLIFLENFNLLNPFHVLADKGIKPVKLFFYRNQQQVVNSLSFISFWRSGEQKIKNLEQRNRELLVEAQKAKALEEENRTIRIQIGAPLPLSWQLQPAQTLGKTRYLTIDQGEKEGVKTGQVAILKNILVGKVIKVESHESQIELPTDPESKIPVQADKTHARGLLSGQFGRGLSLEKVTQDESLRTDDLVQTTGESGYPKDLLVGKISWVEKNESEVFQKAGIEPLLNYEELEIVFLIRN